jgi:hypothetical protein
VTVAEVEHTPPPFPGGHTCTRPTREVLYTLPPLPPPPDGWQGNEPSHSGQWRETVPAGTWNDLWRCHCGRLWRVGNDCDDCDPQRPSARCVRGGYHPSGYAWRPATWWQRLTHRRKL